jgi:exopolyphosphatase/guanosine-5'-triphosphate,3'-diphosphate pyrophosphatase
MTIPDHRRAVIDVGTNSVKLLVAGVTGSLVSPIHEESQQTRLGAGFYQTGQLQRPVIARTAEAVAKFARTAAELGATPPRVIGTSAARDAVNIGELVEAIRRASGLEMEVLSGRQEADWVFRGVTTDPKLAQLSLLILDVGGGSTEFIVGEKSIPRFSNSYPLGSVRLLERLHLADPPGLEKLAECRASLREFLDQRAAPSIEPALRQCNGPVYLIGTGGTATILARMEGKMDDFDRQRIESISLTSKQLSARLENLWQKTLADRQRIPGLPASRADVILTGTAILDAIMQQFKFAQMQISTRGLRYWALLEQDFDKKGGRHCSVRPPNNQTNQPLTLEKLGGKTKNPSSPVSKDSQI